MTGHTPGPWLIEYAETRMRWPVIYVADGAWDRGRREIVSLSTHVAKRTKADTWRKTTDADESEANARLIAAAPALLAFAEMVEAGWKDHPVLGDKARAAIAQAKGPA